MLNIKTTEAPMAYNFLFLRNINNIPVIFTINQESCIYLDPVIELIIKAPTAIKSNSIIDVLVLSSFFERKYQHILKANKTIIAL